MNTAQFAGRLGRDCDLKITEKGDAVCNFSIAVDIGFGDRKDTLWVDCALWGKRAEALAQYLTKGKALTVSGDVGIRTFEKRDGTAGAALTLNVQRLTLQGGGQAGEGASAQPQAERAAPAARAAAAPKQREMVPADAGADFDDDIPF